MNALTEEGIASRLGDMAKRAIHGAKDRVLYAAGDQQAMGRLNHSAALKELLKSWDQYVGQEEAAGNKRITANPTHKDLIEFLMFAYNIQIDDQNLTKLIGINESLNTPFNPRKAFPKLALYLLKNGYIHIERNDGSTYGAAGQKADDDFTPKGKGFKTVSARVTPDGHSIDINQMKTILAQKGITGKDMMALKVMVGEGGFNGYTALVKNPEAIKVMATLIFAVLQSVSDKNDPKRVQAQHSITKDGNMFDINDFISQMHDISGQKLNYIRIQIKEGGIAELARIIEQNGKSAKSIFSVGVAALHAIKKG